MLPSELDNVRSAYRRDMINQRQHELRSNAENVKTSLKQVNRDQLTDWDLETLLMVDEITSNKMHPQLVKFIKKERLANYALVMDDTDISNCIAVYGMPVNQPIN